MGAWLTSGRTQRLEAIVGVGGGGEREREGKVEGDGRREREEVDGVGAERLLSQ